MVKFWKRLLTGHMAKWGHENRQFLGNKKIEQISKNYYDTPVIIIDLVTAYVCPNMSKITRNKRGVLNEAYLKCEKL